MTDIRKMLEDGRCKPNHGCNVATLCMCAALEDAVDEIERLRAEVEHLQHDITNYQRIVRTAEPGDNRIPKHELERIAQDAEIERLRAQVKDLEGVLKWGQGF